MNKLQTKQWNGDPSLDKIVYGFHGPFLPCFYQYLRVLIKSEILKIRRFKFPNLTNLQCSEIHDKVRGIYGGHYYHHIPYICYALHQRGYKYENLASECKFAGFRPDILAAPCNVWQHCEDNNCQDCDVGNNLGFIIVEVGSLSNADKIFVTKCSFVKEFWLIPRGHDFIYIFTVKDKKEHPAWLWLYKFLKKTTNNIEKCPFYDDCHVEKWKKSCFLFMSKPKNDCQ